MALATSSTFSPGVWAQDSRTLVVMVSSPFQVAGDLREASRALPRGRRCLTLWFRRGLLQNGTQAANLSRNPFRICRRGIPGGFPRPRPHEANAEKHMDENACRQWLNEVNWDMIHEDAVTMYLEWGNNNFKDTLRPPVTSSKEYSIYFVVDTWGEPKVVLNKMNNYGSTALCEKTLPRDIADRYMKEIGGLRGIHELNDEVKAWVMKEMGMDQG